MRRTHYGLRSGTGRGLSDSPARAILGALFYPLKLVVHLALMGVAVASVAPLLADPAPMLAVFETFRLHMALASLPLAALALCFRPRLLALLGLFAFAWNIGTVWSYLPLLHEPESTLPGGTLADAKTGADKTAHLKIVSVNVWYRNDDYHAAVNYLESTDADVIALIEVTPQWVTAVQPLFAKYPYRIDCMQSAPPCELLLMSKHPFERAYAGRIEGRSPIIAWGTIAVGERSVTVAATHFAWPIRKAVDDDRIMPGGALQPPALPDAYPLAQSRQAANLAQYLQTLGPDLILMGDFNSVPWSRTQETLRSATGLENAGPMVPTWPSWQPRWSRLPIDHIMTRGALIRQSFKSGFYIGSDHLPVEAEIAVLPK